jgi:hypothetical protein
MTNAYTADPMNPPPTGYETVDRYSGAYEAVAPAASSAVSWAAVFAGAVAAAALSLILLILGTGLGMTAVSPWTQEGMGAKALGISTIVWITVMQLLSAGMGGYLAGRLRTRWLDAARDEVFFRDTAHGFLAWAVATLLTAAVLTSTISAIVGAGVQAGASVVGGAANSAALAAGGAMAGRDASPQARQASAIDYFVDTLFREPAEADTASGTAPATTPSSAAATAEPATPTAPSADSDSSPLATDTGPQSRTVDRSTPLPGQSAAQDSAEIARIYMNADLSQPLPPDDERRVAQIVAQRTGMTQAQAEQRVRQNHAQLQSRLQAAEDKARATADEARKVSATSALWLFVSLLVGAFVASLAATFGGRQRDA